MRTPPTPPSTPAGDAESRDHRRSRAAADEIVRIPSRRRGALGAVLLVDDPVADDLTAAPLLELIGARLHDVGIASMLRRRAMGAPEDSFDGALAARTAIDDAVEAMGDLIAQSAVTVDRVGAVAIGHGAAVLGAACAALPGATGVGAIAPRRIALIRPVAVEIAARRIDRSGAERTPLDHALLTLAEHEPLRRLAACGADVLILHGAADRDHACEISLPYATALTVASEMASTDVERRGECTHELVAYGDHGFTDPALRDALINRLVGHFLEPWR